VCALSRSDGGVAHPRTRRYALHALHLSPPPSTPPPLPPLLAVASAKSAPAVHCETATPHRGGQRCFRLERRHGAPRWALAAPLASPELHLAAAPPEPKPASPHVRRAHWRRQHEARGAGSVALLGGEYVCGLLAVDPLVAHMLRPRARNVCRSLRRPSGSGAAGSLPPPTTTLWTTYSPNLMRTATAASQRRRWRARCRAVAWMRQRM
jgi:hypothetical protein